MAVAGAATSGAAGAAAAAAAGEAAAGEAVTATAEAAASSPLVESRIGRRPCALCLGLVRWRRRTGREQGLQKNRRRWTARMGVAARAARMRTAHPAGCLEVLRARIQAEQEHFERWQRVMRWQGEQVRRMGEQMLENIREARKLSARAEELERESKHRG